MVCGLLAIAALALSLERLVQYFAAFIISSMVLTKYVFPDAFIPVWRYFAVLLSSYMLMAIVLKSRHLSLGSQRIA